MTSIPAVLLYDPVLNDARYIIGRGADGRVSLGAVLELLLIVANIATAVVLYPILKRQNEAGALGYVTARLVESTFIAIGIVSMLAMLTVREDAASSAEVNATVPTTIANAPSTASNRRVIAHLSRIFEFAGLTLRTYTCGCTTSILRFGGVNAGRDGISRDAEIATIWGEKRLPARKGERNAARCAMLDRTACGVTGLSIRHRTA